MMIPTLLLAAALNFSGYVPPHAARDGLRFGVATAVPVAAAPDLAPAMKACGVEDFAALDPARSTLIYQFAVTRAAETSAQCVRSRLPAGSRLIALDHWIPDAQAD